MIPMNQLADYLQGQSLNLDLAELKIAVLALSAAMSVERSPVRKDLFHYPVPLLSEDGSCSIAEQLADEPYDISRWLSDDSVADSSISINKLYVLLDTVNARVGADWLGIYCKVPTDHGESLIKLAYLGKPSRAEFPLSDSFALQSNNSRVAMTGVGVVIDDVHEWQLAGGSYYQCDALVKSEVCLPIIDKDGQTVGILDAESSIAGFFDHPRQVWLAAMAIALAQPLLALPLVEIQR